MCSSSFASPQVYLACKHKKLKTLVVALTLQRIPSIQTLSVFEIPGNKKAKFICQDPWVSITITIITVVTIIMYLYKACKKMTFFRGYLLDSTCIVYIFLSHDCHHVPVKLRGASGPFHAFAPDWSAQSPQCGVDQTYFMGHLEH